MQLRNYKFKTRRIVFKRYDLLLKAMDKSMKAYGLKRLPVKEFEIFVNNIRFSDEEAKQLEILKGFIENYHKTLDLFIKFSKENGKHLGDNCVSLFEVKNWVAKAKQGFIKGQNEAYKKS